MLKPETWSLFASAVAWALTSAADAQTVTTRSLVQQRGSLHCGVGEGLAGFNYPDDQGNWSGLNVDYCKAIAAAVLGDARKVKFVATTPKQRFTALQSGDVDVLIRNVTWTMARDSSFGLMFAGVNFYDGQAFIAKASLGVKSAKQLNGASICVLAGSTTELNLAEYFQTNAMAYKPVVFERFSENVQAYLAGRCDAYTTDQSTLYSVRVQQPNIDEHVVLPEIISKEPLGPLVRQGDDQWFMIVKWVHYALLNAEELGLMASNVDAMANSAHPEIRRLLGKEGDIGKGLGLDNDWAVRIIKAVGNYGEVFDRNVGAGSRLKIERGMNRLWSKGGLHYAPPIR